MHSISKRLISKNTLRSRFASTGAGPSASTQQATSSLNSVSPRPSIYRDLWPSIISCLGVGFVVYYGLELWRTTLDYKWQAHDNAMQVELLKTQVLQLQSEVDHRKSGVFGSITRNDSSEPGRRKWLGIF